MSGTSAEWRVIARQAGTVLVGQLAVMAYGVTDTVVAGRHSDAALSVMSIGSAVFISVYVSLQGIVQALLPIYAEHHGAGRHAEVGRAFRQALYLAAAIAVAGIALLMHPGPLMRWARVPEVLQPEVAAYLRVLAWGFVPALLFRMAGTLTQAVGGARLVTTLQLGSLLVKVPLSVWFTFGGLGLPGLGAVGCAWATLATNAVLMLAMGALMWLRPLYRPYALWHRPEPPDWRRLGEYARLGLPGGLATMIEVTSFTLMALFVARLGTTASAAHQIAASLTAVLYMMPLAMGIAASARTSYWLGAGQPQRARATALTAVRMTLLLALAMAVLVLAGRGAIAALYTAQPAVVALATVLLGYGWPPITWPMRCRACAPFCCAVTASRWCRFWSMRRGCGGWAWLAVTC